MLALPLLLRVIHASSKAVSRITRVSGSKDPLPTANMIDACSSALSPLTGGYSRPHTVHCGPEGIYVSTLGGGGKDGTNGPPGVFIMDCETFDILRWEIDRGPQNLHYDFWWNLPRDYMVTSEWGLPPQFENGIVPEDLLSNKYGHRIHFWDLRARRRHAAVAARCRDRRENRGA
jgi:hypothetical protein